MSGSLPKTRSGSEMALRVLFGVFLAVVAVTLDFLSPQWFAGVVVLVALFGAHEWHRLVRDPAQREAAARRPLHVQTSITGITIALAMMALILDQPALALGLLVVGAAASFVMAQRRSDNPAWHALGVFYLGLPSLALAGIRMFATQGALTVLGLFLIVWATDTGALVFGKLIGGKKLWPAVSPGKTWAGTIGGSFTAVTVFSLYIAFFSFNVLAALLFAAGLSVVAHLGDLFESWVKRRFGTKDSGGLIPGHGGVLDRMDSMVACSVVLALLVFGLHINPMFGGHS
ncbi:MAG: phosphatidate cytidylyltransferase [Alphaproteobacteria bacterium]|nr:phosphatidate cytidylyltransferase [Alphaproteobacteria bacterium]